jgi:hypothetical protein
MTMKPGRATWLVDADGNWCVRVCEVLTPGPLGDIVRTAHGTCGALLPIWSKRRHVDLCRTQTALCR